MDDDERAMHSPVRDGDEVVPFDAVPIGGWSQKIWVAQAAIVLVHTLVMIGVRTLIGYGGDWAWFSWIFMSFYSGVAVLVAWHLWYAQARRPQSLL